MNAQNKLINYNELNLYLFLEKNFFKYANLNQKSEKYLIDHLAKILNIPHHSIIEKIYR